MKLMHLADLHIGKVVNRFPMLDDQVYILKQVLGIMDEEKPDVVMIAGDVYDRTSPSAEAVAAFDDFLYELTKRNVKVMMISGNHDSAERIAYASRILKHSNVYVSTVYNGTIEPVTLSDEYGEVNFYLLPFVKPAIVRNCFEGAEIANYTDAIKVAVEHMNVDFKGRNVLVSHQFITNSELAGSEERSIGGTEDVDVAAVEQFDYVALGHIHKAQPAGKKHVRYSGALLKYAFDEVDQTKSVTMVEIKDKGNIDYRQIELKPKHEMRVIEGKYDEIMDRAAKDAHKDDYVKIILTNESDVLDAIKRVRTAYPNVMQLSYNNTRTNSEEKVKRNERIEKMKPIDIIDKLFEEQNGKKMSDEQKDFAKFCIKEIWG